jgi:hypothetical protein
LFVVIYLPDQNGTLAPGQASNIFTTLRAIPRPPICVYNDKNGGTFFMANRDMWQLFLLIVGGLVYTVTSFAYIHQTFPSKDVMQIMLKSLDRIEQKIDHHYELKH